MGRITAISCMVGAPQWLDGAARLTDLPQDRVDLGLHLDLTQHPLDPAARWPLPALIALSSGRLLDRARLCTEIHAQLDRFEQHVGRPPAHVDGHQHVHQFPIVREVLIDALLARYPHDRPWLRNTRRPPGLPSGFKPWLIERLGCRPFSRLADRHGFRQNTALLGVYDFRGGAAGYQGLLAQWIGMAQHGDLLMCHAGLAAPAQDPILGARCDEYQVLAGTAFTGLLAQARVALARLSRMRPAR